jgi:hypothetical protein
VWRSNQLHISSSLAVYIKTFDNVETHEIGKASGKIVSTPLNEGIVTNNRIVHKPLNADRQSQTTVLFARKPLTCISETSPSGTAPKGISKQTYRKI